MTKQVEKVQELDDYDRAAKYLIGKALSTGDGFMLRAIKTLMDKVSALTKEVA